MEAELTRKPYKLDHEKTISYFINHIKCGKTLSKTILERINFNSGSFFAILPSNAVLERVYDFSCGGIIPPVREGNVSVLIEGSSESFYPTKVITMDQECSEFIDVFLKENSENFSIVENYMLEPDSPHIHIENVKMVPYNNEVYYILNKKNSVQEIYKTIRKSSQVWHFLSVLTRLKKSSFSIFTDETINQVCENAKFVIAGSYDGESYIIWKKESLAT